MQAGITIKHKLLFFYHIDIYSHFNKSILISRNGCIWIDTGNTVKGGVVAFQVLAPKEVADEEKKTRMF